MTTKTKTDKQKFGLIKVALTSFCELRVTMFNGMIWHRFIVGT